MKTIYKYNIQADWLMNCSCTLRLPAGSRWLYAAEQRGELVVYAKVDDAEPALDTWRIWVFSTGHEVTCPDIATPLGMVVLEGRLVFHVFAMLEQKEAVR